MTDRGQIKSGVAVIDAAVPLPDGTLVRVEVDISDAQFWRGKSVTELAEEQRVQPIGKPSDLLIDWPEEDSLDEFLELIRGARRYRMPS